MTTTSPKPAIRITCVNKQFRRVEQGYAGIKGRIGSFFKGIRPKIVLMNALRDINLTIERGETVALIGRNGSGKSTLLSLIAHVMLPDTGTVAFPASADPAHPSLAPLLELGAGFHPDLTGIQNVFFNGSILGLTRADMETRLPEIVAFADLAPEYLNAPVRTYSSGMYVRLAFAVAVHTDPEIILIDEVLAVGDEPFQEKCLAKIAEFQEIGKTIVFVSHDMASVRRVATRAIWLHKGGIECDSKPEIVIDAYHNAMHNGFFDTKVENPVL